jgi:hypothetical protein
MKKIAIKAESIAKPDLLLKALIVLPETAVIAFHTDDGTLYINDNYVDAALSHLRQAGIEAQIIPAR